jgi:alkylation response protein AidB-like acyl-CoA dehydrogenase
MHFGLSEDQAAIRKAVRDLARAEIAPGYLQRAKRTTFPWDIHRRVADLGVLGLLAGREHNPLDQEDHVAAGLAVEELAYADFNVANAVIPVLLMSALINAHSSTRVREEWLTPLVSGPTDGRRHSTPSTSPSTGACPPDASRTEINSYTENLTVPRSALGSFACGRPTSGKPFFRPMM